MWERREPAAGRRGGTRWTRTSGDGVSGREAEVGSTTERDAPRRDGAGFGRAKTWLVDDAVVVKEGTQSEVGKVRRKARRWNGRGAQKGRQPLRRRGSDDDGQGRHGPRWRLRHVTKRLSSSYRTSRHGHAGRNSCCGFSCCRCTAAGSERGKKGSSLVTVREVLCCSPPVAKPRVLSASPPPSPPPRPPPGIKTDWRSAAASFPEVCLSLAVCGASSAAAAAAVRRRLPVCCHAGPVGCVFPASASHI